MAGVCLFGNVVGHPYHTDGKEVLTTALLHVGLGGVVTKSGSEYELGDVDPAYGRLYPDARQRLLRALENAETAPPLLAAPGSGTSWTDRIARNHPSPC